MAKWASSDTLDGGPNHIRSLAGTSARVKQHLIKAYAAGDSYATVVGNSVAVADMTQADLPLSSAGSARVMSVASKSMGNATASSGASPDLHLALVDSVGSAVLLVTDETTDQVITDGNPVTSPAWAWTQNQPV